MRVVPLYQLNWHAWPRHRRGATVARPLSPPSPVKVFISHVLFYGPTLQHEHEFCARPVLRASIHDTCFSLTLKSKRVCRVCVCVRAAVDGTKEVRMMLRNGSGTTESRTANECDASYKVNRHVDLTLFEAACIVFFWRTAKHVRYWSHSSAYSYLWARVHTFIITTNVAHLHTPCTFSLSPLYGAHFTARHVRKHRCAWNT